MQWEYFFWSRIVMKLLSGSGLLTVLPVWLAACSLPVDGPGRAQPARGGVGTLTLGIDVDCPYGLAG